MKLNLLTKKSIVLGTALSICACAIPTYCVLASGGKSSNVLRVKSQREDGVFELELADENNQSCNDTEKENQEATDNNTSEKNQCNTVLVQRQPGVFEIELADTNNQSSNDTEKEN